MYGLFKKLWVCCLGLEHDLEAVESEMHEQFVEPSSLCLHQVKNLEDRHNDVHRAQRSIQCSCFCFLSKYLKKIFDSLNSFLHEQVDIHYLNHCFASLYFVITHLLQQFEYDFLQWFQLELSFEMPMTQLTVQIVEVALRELWLQPLGQTLDVHELH